MAAKGQNRYRQTRADLKYNARYVYGNAVRQPEELPPVRKAAKEAEVRTSGRVIKNRRRVLDISPAYVLFLAGASVCALLICISYLKVQREYKGRAENISALQRELAELTENNDTAYGAIADSVDLNKIRDRAINELGMVYSFEGRIENYSLPQGFVLQYCDIPCDGISAKSCGAAY